MGLDKDDGCPHPLHYQQQHCHPRQEQDPPASSSSSSTPFISPAAAAAAIPADGVGDGSSITGNSALPSLVNPNNLSSSSSSTAAAAGTAAADATTSTATSTANVSTEPISTTGTASHVPMSRLRKGNPLMTASKPAQGPPQPPETFLEDMTPVTPAFDGDNNSDGSPRRHSADLSFDSFGRTSIVDNMLLSLDQLQMNRGGGGGGGGGGEAAAAAATMVDRAAAVAAATVAASAGFNSSQFGDFDNGADMIATDAGPPPPPPPKSPSYYRHFHHHHHHNSDGSRGTSIRLRRRGHTYSSSLSSDYDLYVDDASSRYSHLSKGRRSNSGSNFHLGGLNRIDSLRSGVRAGTGSRSGGEPAGRWVADLTGDGNSATVHTRGTGRKGSKSSGGSSSLDMGHRGTAAVLGTTKFGFGKRSASFDHSFGIDDDPATSILARGRPVPAYEPFDAAPTPTVASGPRWHETGQSVSARAPYNPGYPPPPLPPPTSSFAPRQSGSSRPATGNRIRKGKADVLDPAFIRSQASDFVEAASFRDRSHSAALGNPPAPSPTVARQKPYASAASLANTAAVGSSGGGANAANAHKERPGFFRRVFGGTRSRSPTRNNSIQSMSEPRARGISPSHTGSAMHNHIASQLKTAPRQTSVEPLEALPKEPGTPSASTLTKKSSSFFRRRKKSVSGNARPPVYPVYQTPPAGEPGNSMRPVQHNQSTSSLRQALNPYLSEPSRTERYSDAREQLGQTHGVGHGGLDGTNEATAGFPQEPSSRRDANSRPVGSNSHNNSDASAPSSRDGGTSAVAKRGHADGPRLKLKLKKGITSPTMPAHETTFLAENSDVEGRYTKQSPTPRPSRLGSFDDRQRPKTSPTSPSLPQLPFQDQENRKPQRKGKGDGDREGLATGGSAGGGHSSTATTAPPASDREGDAWIVVNPVKKGDEQPSTVTSAKPNRIWLLPTSSEEKLHETGEPNPAPNEEDTQITPVATPASANDVFHSATSLPLVQVDALSDTTDAPDPANAAEPSPDDRERARKIYNGEEDFVDKANAVPYLGASTPESVRTRKAYMGLFNWSGCNILLAMRGLCARLVLKGETQQVDRVLDAFSARWCECNPNHGFKATDVVHTISYSLLLLNTDLHIADIEQKMTRVQFVKNTLPTIRRVVADAAAGADPDQTIRPHVLQPRGSIPWQDSSSPSSPTFPPDIGDERPSLDLKKSRNRLSARPPPPARGDSDGASAPDSAASDSCNVLVRFPYEGPPEKWEFHIEIVLKDFYNSIRQQRLPLHGAGSDGLVEQPSVSSLSVVANSMLRRTPSVLSKAPSETVSYRGRLADFRGVGARLASKSRSRPRLYPSSTIGSSRTSLDDPSPWSPTGSSTWSKYSFSKTQTTTSVESMGSGSKADYQQSIGFANALSQAIIREEGLASAEESLGSRAVPLLEDETLELAGAPWAKEGILKHKHHLESLDKKAKDRNWAECFAVIEKGWIRLFSFNTKSSASASLRLRANKLRSAGAVVGGGNWTENAEALGSFLLRQTIASALPPPGYSKSRPHVWALSLPTGAVHLFQVGTADIVKEFVSTANYWSARLSKEPLVGGVSNIEYGWGDAIINAAAAMSAAGSSVSSLSQTQQQPGHHYQHHGRQQSGNTTNPPSTANSAIGSSSPMPRRPSLQGSVRASLERSVARLPGDRAVIAEWTPPVQSMMASVLMEVDQLRALTAYVKSVEDELRRHNELRNVMGSAFSPRHPNLSRALANWERKSSYLLREIVKFSTYIDSLTAAQALKEKIDAERKRGEPLTKGVSVNELAARVTGSGPGEGSGNLDDDYVSGGVGVSIAIRSRAASGVTDSATRENDLRVGASGARGSSSREVPITR